MGDVVGLPCWPIGGMSADESRALSALNQSLLFNSPLFPARQGMGPYTLEQVPYLAIGDLEDARNTHKLSQRGVGAVLNLSDMDQSSSAYNAVGIAYQKIDSMDLPTFPIVADTFMKSRGFLDQQVGRGRRVLVHCTMGINRSASVLCAYIMTREGVPLHWAAQMIVTARRHQILTNPGFRRQLARLAAELGVG